MNKLSQLLFSLLLSLVAGAIPFVAFSSSSASSFRTTQTANIGAPECSDGIDNEGDTFIDFPADSDCTSVNGVSEGVAGGGGGDTTPPSIILLSPLDNAVNVSTTTAFVINFNESVVIQTGNIKIKKTSNGNTEQIIAVTSPQVTLSPGSRLTVTLLTPLLSETSYYIELDSGIVNDTSGNAFAGLSGSTAWNFTTGGDGTPPQISNVVATPQATFSDLDWVTNESAISSFFWGTTTDYATGAGTESLYSLNHATTLTNLSPNTLYYYQIEARDATGNKSTATGSFTTLLTADTVPPANPSGFTATAGTNSITLSWTNPTDADFVAVKIMRSTTAYPLTQNDGSLAYDGTAEVTFDASVVLDVRYYYTIFARDTSLNYSSGAIASAIINSVPIVPPPEPPIPPPRGGTPTTTPPLIPPPLPTAGTTTPPLIAPRFSLAFSDFDFFEHDKKITPKKDEVAISEKSELKISLSLKKTPPGSKLFIVSVKDPLTGKISSYLLNKNTVESAYEAVISPAQKGKYPVNIKIYDEYNAMLVDVNGVFGIFSAPAPFLSFLPVNLTENITPTVNAVAPVAVPIGVAIGISQAVILASNIGSFYDIYLLFLKFIGLLTGLFRKKKPEPWGVVYDSVTKQPIDPAYVVVERMEEGEKKTAITDLDGRYGFLLSPGHYSLIANKTHYKFPSDTLAGRTHDELYDNLYFGTSFELAENQILRYNVPLDPMEFDWNEFAKNKDKIFSLYSKKEKLRAWIFNALFYAGLAIAAYGTVLHPTKFNGTVLVVYVALIVFQALWKRRHRVTNLINKATGQPIPFAIISVNFPGMTTLARKIVSDQLGRFYLLVAPGVYDITVQEKQPDGSYALVHTMKNILLKKGVLTEDIVVGE